MSGDGPIPPLNELVSYAADLWFADDEVLRDGARLHATLEAAAAAGGCEVLGATDHVFPNGAITSMLLLSQSHLTIHTWPEYSLANVDLLAYGLVSGPKIIEHIESELRPIRSNVTRVLRPVHGP